MLFFRKKGSDIFAIELEALWRNPLKEGKY